MSYTPEDERLIGGQFDALMKSCERIIKKPEDSDMIRKAFNIAKEAHAGVRRRSGLPYITHPIAVARIVVDEIGLGVKSVCAALLHDVVEDTPMTVEDIERLFTPKIASMVSGLTKIAGVYDNISPEHSNHIFSEQAENFRRMIFTLSDDARVILIKIADRLHNMRTLGAMPVHKQIKITSETMYLFAPLAYRLGLYAIKTELENLSLKYRFPDIFNEITQKLAETEGSRTALIEQFIAPVSRRLTEGGIDFKIEGRVKSPYSIWGKMQRKQIPFEEIYDLFAVRIVFKPTPMIPEKSQCWHIYALITDIYRPHPDRIRDWVNNPKANGYEALHVTVMGPGGVWIEVQIRSERMEEIAERGFAAHWKYKRSAPGVDEEAEFDKHLKEIRDALNGPTDDAVDFLDNFRMMLYTSEVVVFTPKGEQRRLPLGATALDFAYDIHTNVGQHAIGAKINHKIEPIFTQISNGDQIEIITSNAANPKPEWLDHVGTAKARQAIRNYLKGNTQQAILDGIDIFDAKLREFGVKPSARVFRKILPAYGVKTKDEFYAKLGSGAINLDNIGEILRQNSASKMLKFWTIESLNPLRSKGPKTIGISEGNERIDNSDFAIAPCCNPIPGDQIIGFDDPETGKLVVHKASCDELTRLATQHGNRVKSVEWSAKKAMSHLSVIEMRGIDRIGIMLDVSQVIAGDLNVNIREIHIQSHDGIFEGTISLYVKDTKHINTIVDKVKKIKGIDMIKRIS
ncbi:RelA/SpoT family protein [Alistipes sp. OttesenSCG-928-B03]|nr:RelA/SpoT family protein [Alistipes sp. OttesenSCG-928-B03]